MIPVPRSPRSRPPAPRRWGSWILLCLLTLAWVGGPSLSAAAAGRAGSGVDEYELKAGFLANFIKYTTWPEECFEDEEAPIEVLLLGSEKRLAVLEKVLAGKQIQGRRVVVRRARELPEPLAVHVLVADGLSRRERERVVAACRRRPILLVGDEMEYTLGGATMNFYRERDSVRFAANRDELQSSRLEVSSQVLKLARIVKTEDD